MPCLPPALAGGEGPMGGEAVGLLPRPQPSRPEDVALSCSSQGPGALGTEQVTLDTPAPVLSPPLGFM